MDFVLGGHHCVLPPIRAYSEATTDPLSGFGNTAGGSARADWTSGMTKAERESAAIA